MKRPFALTTVLIIILSITSTHAIAQKKEMNLNEAWSHPSMTRKASQVYSGVVLSHNTVSEIQSEIFRLFPGLVGTVLELDTVIRSTGSSHFHFYQVYQGQRVFGGEITANVNSNNRITYITSNGYPLSWMEGSPLLEVDATNSAYYQNSPETGVWLFNGLKVTPAIRKVIIDGDLYEEVILDASLREVFRRDLNMYVDTTLTVHVFNPDPLTTAQSTYVTPYLDSNDQNEANLNPLRFTKSILGTYENGSFLLKNNWVIISDFDTPTFAVTTSSDGVFDYGRSDNRFEQVNAYYHLTTFQLYMQSLGFSLVNYQIPVDANGVSGADNSRFSRATNPPNLSFGEGGVDDAEDADVVIHEYGHAIAHSASPNSNSGTERGCLDEANGDYLAASYSRSISGYGYQRIFTWDGHNQYWNGRNGSSTKFYGNLSFNDIYSNTDIWVAALMDIWTQLGRETTDQILLESLFGYSVNMTMPQAAMLFVQADSTLNGGANIQPIWEAFVNYGILSPAPWNVGENGNPNVIFTNTDGFAIGEPVRVYLDTSEQFHYILVDPRGRVIEERQLDAGTDQLQVYRPELAAGVYVLTLFDSNNNMYTEKLIRASRP